MKNTNSALTITESDRDLQEIILENLKDTLIGNSYEIDTILSSDLWRSLTKAQHRSIGKSFMRLSKAGLIPFQYVDKTSENHNRYQRLS
jgi:hypothetical protein